MKEKIKIEEKINSAWRKIVNEKVGILLAKTKISPDTLTVIGIFASLIAAGIIIKYGLVIGALAILFASLFDLLDGAVAKAKNSATSFGAFLDDVADRIGELFYFSAIFWIESNFPVFVAAVTSILVSYINASGKLRGFKISSGTVWGRPARIILLCVLMLISPWFKISATLWILITLNIFTLLKRGYEIKKQSA